MSVKLCVAEYIRFYLSPQDRLFTANYNAWPSRLFITNAVHALAMKQLCQHQGCGVGGKMSDSF